MEAHEITPQGEFLGLIFALIFGLPMAALLVGFFWIVVIGILKEAWNDLIKGDV